MNLCDCPRCRTRSLSWCSRSRAFLCLSRECNWSIKPGETKEAMTVSLLLTAVVNRFCDMLKANDCEVLRDDDAGTVQAYDQDGVEVFRAIQKGRGQPWIASFRNSDRIQWSNQ